MWPTRARGLPSPPASLRRITAAVAGAALAGAALACSAVAASADAASAATVPLDPESLRDARSGLDHLYHARIDEARVAFERVRARNPESPAADFLLGGIEWHRVTTGPAGFSGGGPAEKSFLARMDAAIAAGEAAVDRNRDDLSARFFLGGAYGYKARYLALQEKWWPAYRTGKKGVGHLERVVDAEPDFADAYLGLGIYHYYSDVLPGVLKFLGTFVGVRGDRGRGLAEIRRALAEGSLVGVEARFFLAEIHTTFEKDQWEALAFSRSLRDEFPGNELFAWLNARVLDELHLVDAARAEWNLLRRKPRARNLRGFLDYRLARSTLYGGDFAGAAAEFQRGFASGGFGSRRIDTWAHVRHGVCLDFLGRHDEAIEQYRRADALDGSDPAAERGRARVAAGRDDPRNIPLAELEETARILEACRSHGERELRFVEDLVTGPSRGLNEEERERFQSVLRKLARARLLRGDAEGCLAAIDRASDSWQEPPRSARAAHDALRALALHRLGRDGEAREAIAAAYRRARGDERDRYERDRDLHDRLAAHPGALHAEPLPPSDAPGGTPPAFATLDHGEWTLEVETTDEQGVRRHPMVRREGTWQSAAGTGGPPPFRYRFVADRTRARIDAEAARITLADDGTAWSSRLPDRE